MQNSFGKVILVHKGIIKPLAYSHIQVVFNVLRDKRTTTLNAVIPARAATVNGYAPRLVYRGFPSSSRKHIDTLRSSIAALENLQATEEYRNAFTVLKECFDKGEQLDALFIMLRALCNQNALIVRVVKNASNRLLQAQLTTSPVGPFGLRGMFYLKY